MNGFISTMLSLMLSWLRALVTKAWALISDDAGDSFVRFLSRHWLAVVLCLCLCGLVLDFVIYFFRWRPDWVWRTRWRHLRAKRHAQEDEAPDLWEASAPVPPAEPPPVPIPPESQNTQIYMPISRNEQPALSEDDLLWDDDVPVDIDWDAPPMPGAYGVPKPEPATYFHDVQSGFAPPLPPQQLYTPSPSHQAPVHPGLNEEAFRQSFGLQDNEEPWEPTPPPAMHTPSFHPFTMKEEEAQTKTLGALSRIAKRARSFVGVDDEDSRTIHDLQPTVDVSRAFHDPVYPMPKEHSDT